MLQINWKSSLGHWYAPVFAPDFPRDPPEIHGCTLFERCKGCPYPEHGFICWQSQSPRHRSKILRKTLTSLTSLPACIRRRNTAST